MSEDYAVMRNAKGQYVVGYGPFYSRADQPDDETAFYVNDFSLSDPEPWKIPAHIRRFDQLEKKSSNVSCSWESPELQSFAGVFSEVSESITSGEIQKSVPVVVERGRLDSGNIAQHLFSVTPHQNMNAYGWSHKGSGFFGHTPEVLFSYEKGRLRTMALAGTATVNEKEVFSVDQKEIQEHEFVSQMLISSLNEIGMVQPDSRRIMELESLVHFHTPIFVGLYDSVPMDTLMQRLHPTPALGTLPRNDKALTDLIGWRRALDVPEHFGAPMGIYDQGEFYSVVCIRGIHWRGDQLALPAGCGVIEASRLTNEWRELSLKRESVKHMFNV